LSADAPCSHIYTLSLHDALPIFWSLVSGQYNWRLINFAESIFGGTVSHEVGFYKLPDNVSYVNIASVIPSRENKPINIASETMRSEEHTSELQSRENLVCRLLLE